MHLTKKNYSVDGGVACVEKDGFLHMYTPGVNSMVILASTVPITAQVGEETQSIFVKPFEEEVGLIFGNFYHSGWNTKLLVVTKGNTAPYLHTKGNEEFFENLFPGVMINFYKDKMEVVVGEERFSTKNFPVNGTRVVDSALLLNFLLEKITLEELLTKAPKTKVEILEEKLRAADILHKEELGVLEEKLRAADILHKEELGVLEEKLRAADILYRETLGIIKSFKAEVNAYKAEIATYQQVIQNAITALTYKYLWWGQTKNALKVLRTKV